MKIIDSIRNFVRSTPDPRVQRADLADDLLRHIEQHEDFRITQFQPVVGGPLGGESARIGVESRSTGCRFIVNVYANGVFAEYRDRITT